MNENFMQFDDIGNYYGTLCVKFENDKYYWSVENYNGMDWVEIPKSLYDELVKFKQNNEKCVEDEDDDKY